HHTNEIAQSEAATGQPFFRYWLHNAFLNIVGGKKMAKSADNFLTLAKVVADLKISPLAYRYASLQVHYRKPMEYSPDSLVAANQALYGLYRQVADLGSAIGQVASFFQAQFQQAINNDLNAAQALAVTFAVINSQLTSADKLATILNFDQVLGFNLAKSRQILAVDAAAIPQNILMMFEQRQIARQAGDFSLADNLRQQLLAAGYKIEDSPDGSQLRPV
nr:cysteine--tRNA ligase [bacterium]